ncbi:hypothetical protein AIOL_004614 [Candidatus Rhodobacter oscarellae]|uniref:DUF2867 domain-containing protein n=1 Tax=Candidatus Rhodobacter oscarellae TaxID=1675527 RepID=A0A0J9EA30_9RHOB|nr:DUF2867 domain-containing protein [Candidatus Rhodobacter lobularis]KMW59632.1 hypothetical protein AIOL_004614 [Candidatus Rhodobacter lobularis]
MPTEIRAIPLPQHSALQTRIAPDDFVDCYAVPSELPLRAAAERIVAFPLWVRALVGLRSVLVAPFGLLRTGPEGRPKLGPFPIEQETETEIIAGFNDRHLNFRIAVRAEGGQVSLATWVHRHNWLGRAYLAAIMPFHILVVRDAVARVSRAG